MDEFTRFLLHQDSLDQAELRQVPAREGYHGIQWMCEAPQFRGFVRLDPSFCLKKKLLLLL